jgi:hypothetical protein
VAPVSPGGPLGPDPVLPRINEYVSEIIGDPGIIFTSVANKSYVSVPGVPSVYNFHPFTFPVGVTSWPIILYGTDDPVSK